MKYFTIKYLVAGTDSILKLCFSIVFFCPPLFFLICSYQHNPFAGRNVTEYSMSHTCVFNSAIFWPWSWAAWASRKEKMQASDTQFTLQLILTLLCKIFGVLNWSSAKERQKCAYYILRANFVLMLFSWWIFNHVLFIFIFSLLCRQARRKWSRRQNNSQTQSKTSLERWVLVKTGRTSAVLENRRDSSAELACPFVQRWWISST